MADDNNNNIVRTFYLEEPIAAQSTKGEEEREDVSTLRRMLTDNKYYASEEAKALRLKKFGIITNPNIKNKDPPDRGYVIDFDRLYFRVCKELNNELTPYVKEFMLARDIAFLTNNYDESARLKIESNQKIEEFKKNNKSADKKVVERMNAVVGDYSLVLAKLGQVLYRDTDSVMWVPTDINTKPLPPKAPYRVYVREHEVPSPFHWEEIGNGYIIDGI